MALRRFHRALRAVAFLVSVLLVFPVSSLASVQIFCSMTGEVGQACGCEHEASTDAEPTISAAPCCEIVSAEFPAPPPRADAPDIEGPELVALRPIAPTIEAPRRSPSRIAVPHGARGPPSGTAPPLFLKYCSFLI